MSTPTTPDIGSVIQNATARRVIYSVYVILAFIAACIQVGFAAAGIHNPTWLTVTLAVVAFAALPVGALAVANTNSKGQTQAIANAVAQAIPVATLTSSDPLTLPTPSDPSQPAAGTQPPTDSSTPTS